MTAFNLQQAVCTGRDFGVNGLLGKLKAWIPQAPLALGGGGPGWYIHDDQSALGTNPYIIVCDQNLPSPNTPAKFIQYLLPSATSGRVEVYYWLYWNPTTHLGQGLYGAHAIPTLDAADFIYDFRGGPQCMFFQTFTTTQWDGSWIDEISLDSNLIDSVSATTAVTNFTAADLQFRGFDVTAGSTIANMVDANGNTYFSISFVSGTTWRINQYASAARSVVIATGTFTTLAAAANTSAVSLAASGGSAVNCTVYMQGPTVADATIVFRYNQITVGSGEGAQFTVGNFYFIYDQTVRNAVNSFQVISKSGDVLTIDRLYRPFPLSAKAFSYAHPFCCGGTNTIAFWVYRAGIPYYNAAGTMAIFNGLANSSIGSEQTSLTAPTNWGSNGNTLGPGISISTDALYISRMSPDRKSRWAVQRPGIVEYTSFGGNQANSANDGKTAYGALKNIIVGTVSTMSPNIHGRKLNGIDYTYFRLMNVWSQENIGWAGMIRETQSNV